MGVFSGPLVKTIVLAGGMALAGAASANTIFTFDSVNDTSTASYYYAVDGATINGTIEYKLTALSSTSATFAVTVTNTSSGSGTNRLVSFGIDLIAPTLTSVSDGGADANVWGETLTTNFPGFQTVDLCVWAGSNCSGGGNAGVGEGGSSSFSLTLSYNTIESPYTITFTGPFPTKWQAVGISGKSYEISECTPGTTDCTPVIPPEEIPEPATLALLGLGVLCLGFTVRKRRTTGA